MYYISLTLIVLLGSIVLNDGGESKVNLKSKTLEDSKNQANASRADFMKSEIKKYLPECGGGEMNAGDDDDAYSDSSRYPRTGHKYGNNQDDDYNQYGQPSHGHNQNNRRNNGDNDRYGQDSFGRNNGRDSNRNRGESSNRHNGRDSMNRNFGGDSSSGRNFGSDSSNRNYGSHSSGRDYGSGSSNRNYGSHSPGRDQGSDSSNRNYGRDSSRSNGGYDRSGQDNGNDDNGGYGSRNYDGYDSGNRDSSSGTGRYGSGSDRRGYSYSGGYLRSKRSEDVECISQCVFGYLEVLDDNRSPSESALLKWMQDNLPNDAKKVKAIREARRCFARLVSSDTSDGCEFSKSLSNCMRLGIEN